MQVPTAPGSQAPALNGILNINKPAGWTSHDVVGWVRKTLHQRSVGHAGTLDPMATGVLLVCLGQATRIAEYLTESEKTYRAVARLGISTDTYDATGEVTATALVPDLSTDALQQALAAFQGEIQQVPPAYSAIKQNGVAAYRKARRGEAVSLPPRPVTIYATEILAWQAPDLTLDVRCGAGTYIRSLVHDLGQALGCGAHLIALTRMRSGQFSLSEATELASLAEAAAEGRVAGYLHPLEAALSRLVRVPVDMDDIGRLAHGQPIGCTQVPAGQTGYALAADGQVVAILEHRNGQWWPHKVFQQVSQEP